MTTMVNLNNPNGDVLMQLDYIRRMSNATIGHLRDMYQSVLMHTNIHKSTKIADASHYALNHAANFNGQ